MPEKFDPSQIVNADEKQIDQYHIHGQKIIERLGLARLVYYSDADGKYYMKNRHGEWKGREVKYMQTFLKHAGCCPMIRTEQQEKNSELDLALACIAMNYTVDFAGALAGCREGIQDNNGHKILVTKSFKLPEPKPGEFETIRALIEQQLAPRPGEGICQLDQLYGWWVHSIECLLHGYDKNLGMALVLAGRRGCGKSLLKLLIKESLGGREAQPYSYLSGKTQFCGEFLRAELLAVDDDQCQTDAKSRDEMATKIKKIVSDETFHVSGKHVESMDLKLYRRLLICVNDEPEKLLVLPHLHDDIIDKIHMLHCLPPLDEQDPMPMPVKTPQEQDAFKRTLLEELPAFMHWLLNEYEIPDALYGRFGVVAWQHPDIKAVLFDLSCEAALLEQIERSCFSDVTAFWHGNSTELYKRLTDEDLSALSGRERNAIRKPIWLGRQLSRISTQHPGRCQQMQDSDGQKEWYICRADRTLEGITPAFFKQRREEYPDDEEII